MVGQPGQISPPHVPRSPHKRILPTAREPGLWSGDSPRANSEPAGWRTRLPMVMNIHLPSSAQEEDDLVRACAVIADMALKTMLTEEAFYRANLNEQTCLVAKLYRHCANVDEIKVTLIKYWGREVPAKLAAAVARKARDAESWKRDACTERGLSPWVERWVDKIQGRWRIFDWRQG